MLRTANPTNRFGHYRLAHVLGRGGMAEVFSATVETGGRARAVAIKRMLPHLAEDPVLARMFLAEGRLAARLAHENICQVSDVGEIAGSLYLELELLEGETWFDLANRLCRDGGDPRLVAGVLLQACEGLHFAHSLHDGGRATPVVHRDVSPQNLFVTRTGVCKVLDFGVSKGLTESTTTTRAGVIKGKLSYMAPEQTMGQRVDVRADVFAMGVLIWEALAGHRLFSGDSDYAVWRAVLEAPILPLSYKRPDLPFAFDDVVMRALERDRERRFPSIRALADALAAAVAPLGGPLSPAAIGPLVRVTSGPQPKALGSTVELEIVCEPEPETMREPEHARVAVSSPGRVAAVLFGAAIAAAVAAMIILRHTPEVVEGAHIELAPAEPARPPAHAAVLLADDPPVATVAPSRPVIERTLPRPARVSKPRPKVTRPVEPVASSGSADRGLAAVPPIEVPIETRPPGLYSLTTTGAYGAVTIGGKVVGDTPLYEVELAAGSHRVTLRRSDGVVRTFTIEIAPGRTTSGRVSW